MPSHEYVCRQCGDTITLTSPPGRAPNTPYCNTCRRRYAKVFGFSFTPIPIEIKTPGGRFGSMKAAARERGNRAGEHSERAGRDVVYEPFDAKDPEQNPTLPGSRQGSIAP